MRPSFDDYRQAILDTWTALSCTRGRPPRTDHTVLLDLYRRGIPLSLVLVAFRLAAARRSPDLSPVRSVAYFQPVINELVHADPDYVTYLEHRLSL
jgi:hypothetical protein